MFSDNFYIYCIDAHVCFYACVSAQTHLSMTVRVKGRQNLCELLLGFCLVDQTDFKASDLATCTFTYPSPSHHLVCPMLFLSKWKLCFLVRMPGHSLLMNKKEWIVGWEKWLTLYVRGQHLPKHTSVTVSDCIFLPINKQINAQMWATVNFCQGRKIFRKYSLSWNCRWSQHTLWTYSRAPLLKPYFPLHVLLLHLFLKRKPYKNKYKIDFRSQWILWGAFYSKVLSSLIVWEFHKMYFEDFQIYTWPPILLL